MFCDRKSENIGESRKQSRGKRNRKRRNSNKNAILKNQHRFAVGMTSWAENFTFAATFQLKHQLALWKAKALSLEYENKILHDIIRKNCLGSASGSFAAPQCQNEDNFEGQRESDSSESEGQRESDSSESDGESASEPEVIEEKEGEFELSEEFIEFLRKNAKFKEKHRLEMEKLKAKGREAVEELEAGPSKPVNRTEELKQLYGADYKRIGALELAVQLKYDEECDKSNPVVWPNIPFNFN